MSQLAFSSLKLQPELLGTLTSLGYTEMTPIQAQSLPQVLAGKDVIGQGKTGSGKTAAFALGLLQKLDTKLFSVQSLVLCPTRELADQVSQEIRKLARAIPNVKVLTLYGGVPYGPQVGSLEHGVHIVVGTPGRTLDHLEKGTLNLDGLRTLVLDEADRMLDMGFQDALDAIIKRAPSQRQSLLFSATFPDRIQSISKRVLRDPVMVKVDATHDNLTIQQHFFKIDDERQRLMGLRLLLLKFLPESTLVFCNTRRETQAAADYLRDHGFSALALHGDLEQRDRDQTLLRFANRSASVLVATDVAARGLDIDSLDAVINYQVANDPEVHVHRVGRTGRAGSRGLACTLWSGDEGYRVAQLECEVDPIKDSKNLPGPNVLAKPVMQPPNTTLQISAGKKQKIRPGDILGALTGEDGITGKQVGKIHVADNWAYVAVHRSAAKPALKKLAEGKLKGRTYRVRHIRN